MAHVAAAKPGSAFDIALAPCFSVHVCMCVYIHLQALQPPFHGQVSLSSSLHPFPWTKNKSQATLAPTLITVVLGFRNAGRAGFCHSVSLEQQECCKNLLNPDDPGVGADGKDFQLKPRGAEYNQLRVAGVNCICAAFAALLGAAPSLCSNWG